MTASPTGTFAAAWAAALHGPAGRAGDDVAATERQLTRLVERLASALVADPFVPDAGHEVGAELFGVHAPRLAAEPLGTSVACLAGLPDALGIRSAETGRRLPLLLGALVSGYTAALRACTMDDLDHHPESHGARAVLAERALRTEQARYRAVLTGVEVPVALCEPDGRFVDANPAFVDLLRHRVQYLRGHTLYDLACPADAPMLARVVEHDLVRARHRRVRTEVTLRRRSGSLIAVPLALTMTRDGSGAPVHLVAAATRRRADGPLAAPATDPRGLTIPRLGLVPDGVLPAAGSDAT
jgi:PAS domain S-box-containing protein